MVESGTEKPRKTAYHHGDLRATLLRAAEEELDERGIEGFTLRGCAKRAGVSHAAPTHHFGDANGLLTALAAVGFERFLEVQTRVQAEAGADARARHTAAGLGYIRFALENPELFRLMFSSRRADFSDAALQKTAMQSFDALLGSIAALRGVNPREDQPAMLDVLASWALAHGLSDLLLSGRMLTLADMPGETRERTLAEIFTRSLRD
ncbi:TetR/AcrR family transcriptional regulator [Aquamicrobium sp. LC103]|uniref:TetR/AcrR family transcriptional regulator n=1 Tax=Aquamicrobium sp. LC103 TaxID=1120658 RepID=UPI00063EB5CB|nr:TetR/AcrR family transcriptional regulator [Aquamicrobium sp. LC103]TKT77523.1 TetR/AcrR family transcriptional regulator [Aquamicrobium sp. LC103]